MCISGDVVLVECPKLTDMFGRTTLDHSKIGPIARADLQLNRSRQSSLFLIGAEMERLFEGLDRLT